MANDNIATRKAVYEIPGMELVSVRKDLIYRTADIGPLTMDLYSTGEQPQPAVVLVEGYNDVGFEKAFGCRFKDTGMIVSWAQLMAASGLTAITYTNRDPATDLEALLDYAHGNAEALGIDAARVGIWATSGNVPVALSALTHGRAWIRCAALLYGFMLDLDGATGVAEAAATFRFANPNAGKSLDDLPGDLPLLLVRAGLEQFPHLNDSIDRFVANAVALNRPIMLVNHATGPHAFDLLHDTETSREIIRGVLGFLRAHLTPAVSGARTLR